MDFGNFKIDEGVNPNTGVRTIFHFEGDQVVCQKIYDATPYLQRAAEMRARNEGKRWDEGKEVGVIPPWAAHILQIEDDAERERAMKAFWRANRQLCGYEPYLQ